jgi:hypothetical protein
MTKELTEQDKQKIKDSIIASCISKGIKPTVQTDAGMVSNPMYASCVDLGYQDALKEAEKGKLGLWFEKVNSFVQSQGGVTGLFQSVQSIATQYRANTPNMPTGTTNTIVPNGYSTDQEVSKQKTDNMGLWFVMIILLVILIIAALVYFKKPKVK